MARPWPRSFGPSSADASTDKPFRIGGKTGCLLCYWKINGKSGGTAPGKTSFNYLIGVCESREAHSDKRRVGLSRVVVRGPMGIESVSGRCVCRGLLVVRKGIRVTLVMRGMQEVPDG